MASLRSFQAMLWIIAPLLSGQAVAQDKLSEQQARSIVENSFYTYCRWIVRGEHNVFYPGRGDTDYSKKRVSAEEFDKLVAWSEIGLIRLEVAEMPAGASFTTGIRRKVRITALPKGEKANGESGNCRWEQEPGEIRFVEHTPKVTRVVAHEVQKRGANTYLLAKGTIENTFTPIGLEFLRAMRERAWRDVKFIELLVHDEFSKSWKLVAKDITPLNHDFQSNNVDQYLARLPR